MPRDIITIRRRQGIFFTPPVVTFGCTGTQITLLDPDNTSTGNWNNAGCTSVAAAATDPFGGSNASTVTSTAAGSFAAILAQIITITPGVTYKVFGYLKSLVSPTWAQVTVQDNNGSTFDGLSQYFNLTGAGTVGTGSGSGTGTLTCAQLASVGSGWYKFSVAGITDTLTPTQMRFNIAFADSNGSSIAAIGQEYAVYHLGTAAV